MSGYGSSHGCEHAARRQREGLFLVRPSLMSTVRMLLASEASPVRTGLAVWIAGRATAVPGRGPDGIQHSSWHDLLHQLENLAHRLCLSDHVL